MTEDFTLVNGDTLFDTEILRRVFGRAGGSTCEWWSGTLRLCAYGITMLLA